jgi:hypothetical protein
MLSLLGCQSSTPSRPDPARTEVGTTTAAVSESQETEDCAHHGDAAALVRASLLQPPVAGWTEADEKVLTPIWSGDDAHGAVILPQWRGAGAGIEEYEYAPPGGDCRKLRGTVRADWDSAANTVQITMKYRGLPQHPSVRRTEGVDFFPNQYHQIPKDFDDGRYRLWVILGATTNAINFYYDPVTLQILGSQLNFPGGPPNNGQVITIRLPVFGLSGSAAMQPDASGNLFHQYSFPYNSIAAEGGFYSIAYNAYLPFNLCNSIPSNPALGQLRPYVSPWQAPGAGPSWKTILHSNLTFDLQLEKPDDATPATGGNLPYVFGGVALMGNSTGVQGGVPNGYRQSIPAAIQNVSPVILPLPGNQTGLGCTAYVNDPHIDAPNFCALGH